MGAAAALVAGLLVVVAGPAQAATGVINGTVFEDFNANGTKDAGSTTAASASAADIGVAGATAKITDSLGNVLATVTTNATGVYTATVTPGTGANATSVRVEITPPTGYQAGPQGTDSKGLVQFLTLGTSGNVGLTRIGDYSQDAPRIIQAQMNSNVNSDGTLINQSAQPSIQSFAYSDRGGTPTTGTVEAYAGHTGSIYGLANLQNKYIFSAAFFKRHSQLGAAGLGGIYLTTVAGAPNGSAWVTIPNAGTDPRAAETGQSADFWFHDSAAYANVGKIGLGSIALAPDQKSIYVVNLNSKSLWQVPFTYNSSGVPVAGTPVEVTALNAVPGAAGTCTAASLRPLGVDAAMGSLWVTMTCASSMRGYVYKVNPATNTIGTAPAFEMSLTGYTRGIAYAYPPFTVANGTALQATNHAWSDTFQGFVSDGAATPTFLGAYAQPWLGNVTFAPDGDMTIGVRDRFSDQTGYHAGNLTAGNTIYYDGNAAGDVLRACANAAVTAWTLESNGSCGGVTGSGAGNAQGPGNGEYYQDSNIFGLPDLQHQQTPLGTLLQVPGYTQVVSTDYDPGDYARTNGYRFYNHSTGNFDNSTGWKASVYSAGANGQNSGGAFGKAGGLGEIDALVNAAPVEIGNRVWFDTDKDGVQDAAEANVAGATVHLYAADGTTLIATAVTDAGGNYYFTSAAGTSTASTIYGLALVQSSNYVIRLDRPADYATGGVLAGYTPTTADVGGDDQVDSDATLVSGYPQISATTPAFGADHTFDVGLVKSAVSVGDFVWLDSNHNGIQDTGEPGIAGVKLNITAPGGGAGPTSTGGRRYRHDERRRCLLVRESACIATGAVLHVTVDTTFGGTGRPHRHHGRPGRGPDQGFFDRFGRVG